MDILTLLQKVVDLRKETGTLYARSTSTCGAMLCLDSDETSASEESAMLATQLYNRAPEILSALEKLKFSTDPAFPPITAKVKTAKDMITDSKENTGSFPTE